MTDSDQLREALEFLGLPGPGLVDVAAINTVSGRMVASGLFDDVDLAVEAAADLDQHPNSVYVGLNPRRKNWPSINQLGSRRPENKDVLQVQSILIDIDPLPKGGPRPSLDADVFRCEEAARQVVDLIPHEGAALLRSGNGAGVWLRVDLPADDETRELIKRLLRWTREKITVEGVEIDLGASSLVQLTALPGTTKRKLVGLEEPSAERPFRQVELVQVFEPRSGFAEFLQGLPPPPERRLVSSRTATGGTPSDLCPGWFKVWETVGSGPGEGRGDTSASAVAFRLVRAMLHRTGMSDSAIVDAIWTWDQAVGEHYHHRERVEDDVDRISQKDLEQESEVSCEFVRDVLNDDTCAGCPESMLDVRVACSIPSRRPSLEGCEVRLLEGGSLGEARDDLDDHLDEDLMFWLGDDPGGASRNALFLYRPGAGVGKTYATLEALELHIKEVARQQDSGRPPPRFAYLTDTYRNALEVMSQLQDRGVKVALFHPKIDYPLPTPSQGIKQIEGYCEKQPWVKKRRSRCAGQRDEYRETCGKCVKRRRCRYIRQRRTQTSFVGVQDFVGLVGPDVKDDRLPDLVVFDEDPTRAYLPEVHRIAPRVVDRLGLKFDECPALLLELYKARQNRRKEPKPALLCIDGLDRGQLRKEIEQLARQDRAGQQELIVRSLVHDINAAAPPYRVWIPPLDELSHSRKSTALLVCEPKDWAVHDDMRLFVLNATADPRVLRLLCEREIKVVDEPLQPDCEVIQIPIDASRTAVYSQRTQEDLFAFLRALEERHSEEDPLALISYKRLVAQYSEGTPPSNKFLAEHFGALRGVNKLRSAHEMVIIGAPIPNLNDFVVRACSFLEQHEGRTPSLGWSSAWTETGCEYKGSPISTRVLRFHDEMMQALFDQACAAELYQAAFRLRPHAEDGKRIWLFGRQPIWNLPTTRLLSLEEALEKVGVEQQPPRGRTPSKMDAALGFIRAEEGNCSIAQIIAATGVSKSTAKRARREFKKESAGEALDG